MTMRNFVYLLATLLLITVALGTAQNFEITGHIGGQLNGGLDLSTTRFHRIEVGNSMNYGITAGYLLGQHYGVEFLWNHSKADTRAEPNGGLQSITLFSMTQNQYMGNFLFHLTGKDSMVRPFVFFGLGANDISANRTGVASTTRFAYSFGGGAKYNVSRHFGFRGQIKWAPTYITSTADGYWCDPFWGGCWVVGNDHYLHEFDITGGITLRF